MLGIAAVPYLREGGCAALRGFQTPKRTAAAPGRTGCGLITMPCTKGSLNGLVLKVPLVAMGHLFVAGSSVGGAAESVSASSDEEDASVYVGSLRNVSAAAFGEGWRYIALGHIHRPQAAAGSNGNAWYCGSPLMLDFGAISR